MNRVVIVVREIRGNCPVFKVGDRMVFDGAALNMDLTDAYCVWAAQSFTPFLISARRLVPPSELGLAREGLKYLVQCLDPGPPLTDGGTVVFEMHAETSDSDTVVH
ncbi:MAG: TIGR04076 family protein [Candidatus Thorarchaeota archaeon]